MNIKRLSLLTLLLSAAAGVSAQNSISHIESSGSWYYIYDHTGKKYATISSSIGQLQGFSASFFVVRSGSWYYIYDAAGKKRHTMSVSSVGEILSVAGDTFTSRSGAWVYTWNSEGKKLSTRSAPR